MNQTTSHLRARAGRACGALLSLLVLLAGSAPAAAQEPADAEKLRALALQLVNRSRGEHKLAPLKIGKEVNEAAKAHALDMLRRNFYSHTSPEGQGIQDRFLKAGGGRWRLSAENIARCTGCGLDAKTVEELQRGWMNSKAHRENILRKGITEFGFAIVAAPGKPLYAVQTFSGPGIPSSLKPGETPKRISESEAAARALALLNKERKQASRPALAEAPALTKALRSLLPPKTLEGFSLDKIGGLRGALPEAERDEWQNLSVLAAACGGCGNEPTDADLRDFVQQWLSKPGNKAKLLDPDKTHLGFVLAASGQGKKVALAVLGKKQPK